MLRACLLVVSACLAAARARADSSPSERTRWLVVNHAVGAETCLDAARLDQAVRARLTASGEPANGQLNVSVTWSFVGDGFQAVLALTQSKKLVGTRQLTSRSATCEELGQAVTLALALALDLEFSKESTGVAAAPESAPATEQAQASDGQAAPRIKAEVDQTPAVATPKQREAPPSSAGYSWPLTAALRAGAAARWNFLPDPTFGPALSASLRPWKRLSFDLSVSGFPKEASAALVDGRGTVGFRAALATFMGCTPIAEGGGRAALGCVGISSGIVRFDQHGALAPTDGGTRALFAARAALFFRQRLMGRLAGFALAGVELPLVRHQFVYDVPEGGSAEAYRLPWLSGVLEAGFEWETFEGRSHKLPAASPYTG